MIFLCTYWDGFNKLILHRRVTIQISAMRMLLLFIAMLIMPNYCSVSSVTSSSPFVGVVANYSIVLSNQTNLTRLDFYFSNWTTNNPDPFSSRTILQLTTGTTTLNVTPSFVPLTLACSLGQTVTGSSFTLVLTNMRNPSSTKPYNFVIRAYSTAGGTNYTASMTLSSVSNTSFPMVGYSTDIGRTSTGVSFYLSPQYALILSSPYLQITYDSSLITLSFGTGSSYSILSSSAGSLTIYQFTTTSLSQLIVDNVTAVNPQAAISYTINCRFYVIEGGVQYDVENFYAEVNLVPVGYTTLSTVSSLEYGKAGSLNVLSSCLYSQVSGPSSAAYTVVSYNSSQLSVSGAVCTSTSTSTCQHTLTNNYTLTSFTASIST